MQQKIIQVGNKKLLVLDMPEDVVEVGLFYTILGYKDDSGERTLLLKLHNELIEKHGSFKVLGLQNRPHRKPVGGDRGKA